MNSFLDTLPPEEVVDILAPLDGTFGDSDFAAFVSDLDTIRDLNEYWLVLSEPLVRAWVESAEVY